MNHIEPTRPTREVQRVVRALSGQVFPLQNEEQTSILIAHRLSLAGIPHRRNAAWPFSRLRAGRASFFPDFVCCYSPTRIGKQTRPYGDGVLVIEVKQAYPRVHDVHQQVRQYANLPGVYGVLLLTPNPMHRERLSAEGVFAPIYSCLLNHRDRLPIQIH